MMVGPIRSTRARNTKRTRGGFTLIEVMIASVILAVGLLGIAMMQLQALRQGAQGRHTTDAAAVGRTYIEQAHRLPWSALGAAQTTGGGGWTDPAWQGTSASVTVMLDEPGVSGGTAVQTYAVQWKVNDVAGNACLRDVEISVTWDEEHYDSARTLVLSTRRYNWGGSSC